MIDMVATQAVCKVGKELAQQREDRATASQRESELYAMREQMAREQHTGLPEHERKRNNLRRSESMRVRHEEVRMNEKKE